MSRDNVEIVRAALTEFDQTLQLTDAFAPDFVWDVRAVPANPRDEYHGWEGFEEFFAEWTATYEEWQQRIEEIRDGGDNQVVVLAHQRGRLRDSQAWVEWSYGLIYTVEDGLIRRVRVYPSFEEAVQAAGPSA